MHVIISQFLPTLFDIKMKRIIIMIFIVKTILND